MFRDESIGTKFLSFAVERDDRRIFSSIITSDLVSVVCFFRRTIRCSSSINEIDDNERKHLGRCRKTQRRFSSSLAFVDDLLLAVGQSIEHVLSSHALLHRLASIAQFALHCHSVPCHERRDPADSPPSPIAPRPILNDDDDDDESLSIEYTSIIIQSFVTSQPRLVIIHLFILFICLFSLADRIKLRELLH